MSLPSLYDQTPETLKEQLIAAGYPGFRAQQILEWLYAKRATNWEAMRNLPKPLRAWLEERYCILATERVMQSAASDTTQKLLYRLADGALIETVMIKAPDPKDPKHERLTLCVSSQVGCAFGCRFCASGLNGFKRNLAPSEIFSQILNIPEHEKTLPFDNLVFMGMGEPLSNLDAVLSTIRIIQAPWGLGLSGRRITVSTSGFVPGIERLAETEDVDCRLAISLHATTDAIRDTLMPINKRYPLEVLFNAIRTFTSKKKHQVTLEYILIHKHNDSQEDARRLAKIARELHAHINLIPYNPVQGLPWERPSLADQKRFAAALGTVSFTLRREKGSTIDAACGQLRLRMSEENPA